MTKATYSITSSVNERECGTVKFSPDEIQAVEYYSNCCYVTLVNGAIYRLSREHVSDLESMGWRAPSDRRE